MATVQRAPRRMKVAVIGARGYVGAELLKLLARHPWFEVACVTSRGLDGRRVADEMPQVFAAGGLSDSLVFETVGPDDVPRLAERGLDVWVLALPNGHSQPWVDAIERHHPEDLIVDLSTDHRFDARWVYGLPEIQRRNLVGARRIANPGCYATAAQLALHPVIDLLDGPAHVFGVSGYSGAGTTPSPKNDPAALRDNLMPYALVGHAHEQEIRWQLGHKVFFMPHVAPFFAGIVATVSMPLRQPVTIAELAERYEATYRYEPLVRFQSAIPLPRDAAGKHGATLGGLALDATDGHAVLCATLDNLLKGAATQCLQNMNLASGIDELAGLRGLL